MKSKNIYKWLKALKIMFISFLLVWINYIYLRPYFYMYDKQLRYFDHFLAGIAMPKLVWLLIDNVKGSSVAYAIASLVWETWQWWDRGFFQIDQLVFDLIGIGVFVLIKNRKALKNKCFVK